MSPSATKPLETMGRKLNEHLGGLGEEVRRVVTLLNERVVPEVRQNSSVALRAAAEQLWRVAEQLDKPRPQDWQQQKTPPHSSSPAA
jgi:hypothetical protein